MKKCPKCGEMKDRSEFYNNRSSNDGLSWSCKECTNMHQREYRKTDARKRALNKYNNSEKRRVRQRVYDSKLTTKNRHKEWRRSQDGKLYEANVRKTTKHKARMITNRAIREGIISRKPCEICGEEDAEAHHEDYSKPFSITWLCFNHHRMLHKEKKT